MEDDEEEAYLQANPLTIPILEVDVETILKQYQKTPSLMYVGVASSRESSSTNSFQGTLTKDVGVSEDQELHNQDILNQAKVRSQGDSLEGEGSTLVEMMDKVLKEKQKE